MRACKCVMHTCKYRSPRLENLSYDFNYNKYHKY